MNKLLRNRQNSGITLIALVITIIVLLILAGIGITNIIGENGIINKTKEAKEKTEKSKAEENVKLAWGDWEIKAYTGRENVEDFFYEKFGMENVISNVNGTLEITTNGQKVIINKFTGEIWNIDISDTIGDGKWDLIKKVNSPKLKDGMKGVIFDENGNPIEVTEKNKDDWYDYSNSKWANAQTSDGSYWVWIPRYAYKINSMLGQGGKTGGQIDIVFLEGTTNKNGAIEYNTTYPSVTGDAMDDFVVHPVFTDGSEKEIPFGNGEWDSEISGFWMAKYEASEGNNNKPLSIPGVHSWTSLNVGNSYTNSLNLFEDKNSHLTKNSEWGAVAYLTQSKYGRNGVEVDRNTEYYTGGSLNATAKTNVAQSTTNNEYGIFDMRGGVFERVAAYISNGNGNLAAGASFANTTRKVDAYKTDSDRLCTIYPFDESKDATSVNGYKANYINYKSKNYGFGDAILETSSTGFDYTAWYEDHTSFLGGIYGFFVRSDILTNNTSSGLFYFACSSGNVNGNAGFRVCLTF